VFAVVNVLGLMVFTPGIALGQDLGNDFATHQQRAHLLTVHRSTCGNDRGKEHRKKLSGVTSTNQMLDVTTELLAIAQNKMGEGEADVTWGILCGVLDARIRVIGPTSPRTIAVFNNFGVLLRKQGYLAESRRILQALEPIVRNYPIEGATSTGRVLNNLGTTLLMQGYYEQAEATLRRSLAFAETTRDTTPTLTNIAKALEVQGKLLEAEQMHREILEMRRAAAISSKLDVAATLNNLGAVLTAQGRALEGEPFIREGIGIRESELDGNHLNIGYSLENLVRNLVEQSKFQEARDFADRLLHLRQSALGRSHSETFEAHRWLAEVLSGLGESEQAMKSARAALESALFLSARETVGLDDDAATAGRRASSDAAFTLVATAWRASKHSRTYKINEASPLTREAFLATQRISKSSTSEAIFSASARNASNVKGSNSLVQQFELELTRKVQLDSALAKSAAKGIALQHLQDKLAQLEKKHAVTSSALRKKVPSYFDLIRPEPISLEVISTFLKQDEVLFVITPGIDRRRGYVWVVTQAEVGWDEIKMPADELHAAINDFRQILDPGNVGPEILERSARPVWSVGHEIYKAIFSSPQIIELAKSKPRWILAPQGVLMSLPFNALMTSAPDSNLSSQPSAAKLRSMDWLGLEKSLSLLPSAASIRVLRSPTLRQHANQPFFGLGDPYFPDSKIGRLLEVRSRRGVSVSDLETLRQLDPLPGTRIEIKRLANLLGAPRSAYLLGAEANERTLWRRIAAGKLQNAKVLAFATHGLIGGELFESIPEPALVLSPPPTASANHDGLLTASEVRRMKIRAEWVLLSACNTAAGSRQGAEGLTGIARSFLFAGARSLLISHWRLMDTVAPRISGRVIELTQQAAPTRMLSRASALQQAMKELMLDSSRDDDELVTFAHPSAWAAFAFVGVD
jgi:CHAT domain-containing protein/tetratricopeptide (TPR) repeat protein